MSIWRDVDSDRRAFGITAYRSGVTVLIGRRMYRAHWGRS